MDKLLTFSGYDSRSGPHIFPIEADVERTIGHIKMARPLPPKIEQYIRTAKPVPGKTQLLIDAMGAGEYWGSNVNGDYFPEEALAHPGPDYGFETFMHYAYPFKHHVNKDPARAYGDKVTLSAYDPHMHRILLIVHLHDDKCKDVLGDLANGKYWDVSMGCRVPWDECSVCGNRASNRAAYCAHLKYQMNKILPNGVRVMAINRKPKLFDISLVAIGAEKASHVLSKVAHALRPYEVMSSAEAGELFFKMAGATKSGAEKKTADIDKEVPSNAPTKITPIDPAHKDKILSLMDDAGDVKSTEAPLPNELLDSLAGVPLSGVFSTLAALGIDLRPEEFQRIVLVKVGHRELAEKLAARRLVFNEARPGRAVPPWAADLANYNLEAVNEKVAMAFRPYMAERSIYPEILATRILRFEKRGSDPDKPQWYPMDEEQKRKASGMSGLVPASLALATGFMMYRKLFPQLADKAPIPLRTIMRHPWLLPILLGAGVGASVGLSSMMAPRSTNENGTGRGLDGNRAPVYDVAKTASISAPLARFGLIPLAYLYAGVQQRRWERGERLSAVDRLIASRPDLAALGSFAIAPTVVRGVQSIAKMGSVVSDMGLYALGTTSKLMPAVLAGAALDSLIFRGIQRLASRKQKGSI